MNNKRADHRVVIIIASAKRREEKKKKKKKKKNVFVAPLIPFHYDLPTLSSPPTAIILKPATK